MSFKGDNFDPLTTLFSSPSGYWIVTAREIGPNGATGLWYVRVLDFATYKHRRFDFPTEAQARTEADLWRL